MQRFLTLAACPSENEPPIRVLFYGQSIIYQWWSRFAEELRRQYPSRPWVFENRSLGGHMAPFLLKTAEADVYPLQPDLLVFHEYDDFASNWGSYGAFLERVRQRTCADILMVGNHIASYDALDEDSIIQGLPIALWPGVCAADAVYLPAIARNVGACWADIRNPWKQYLITHKLDPASLRLDNVHLNEAGIQFVIELLRPYLRPPIFAPPIAPYGCGRVTRLRIEDRAEMPFEGNRVLLWAGPAGVPSSVACLLDGEKPSVRRELYVQGRTSGWPDTYAPALLKIESVAVPAVEDWTLTVDEVLGPRVFSFRVAGTVTGPDGDGRSDRDFTSHSGRVRVRSADWYWEAPRFSGKVWSGFQVCWRTQFFGSDTVCSSDTGRWVEVANGLVDGPHTLRLERLSGTRSAFSELLVYHPGGSDAGGAPDLVVRYLRGEDSMLVR